MQSEVTNIRTRFAIVKRAEKILKEVDAYFEDAADFGLSVAEADPRGELVAIRKGVIVMLERERRLGYVKLESGTLATLNPKDASNGS